MAPSFPATGITPAAMRSGVVRNLAVCAAVLLALHALGWAFRHAGGWALPWLAGMLAWPLWAHWREQLMLGRRVLLDGIALPESRVRRWFWAGSVSQALRIPLALACAFALLAATARLTPLQWAILTGDALLLLLLVAGVRRFLAGQVVRLHLGAATRRWPVVVTNVVVLSVAFIAHDYWMGFPDTRDLGWEQLVSHAMQSGEAGASSAFARWALTVSNLATDLPRHAALLWLPGIADPTARTLAWLAFLAATTFGSYLFTCLLLGAQAIAEEGVGRKAAARTRDGLFVVIAMLVVAVVLVITRSVSVRVPSLQHASLQAALAVNPCARALAGMRADRVDYAHRQLDAAAMLAVDEAMDSVDRQLDEAFAAAGQGVEKYLDEYFSWNADYRRIAGAARSSFGDYTRARFTKWVVTDSGFGQRLQQLDVEADALLIERMARRVDTLGHEFTAAADQQPCMRELLRQDAGQSLGHAAVRASLAGAVALPLSRAMRGVAQRATTALLTRSASSSALKAMASVAGKSAARRGAGAAAAAGTTAAVCGPAAPACAAVAFLVTWVGMDAAAATIDEKLFRDRMKMQLMEELSLRRNEVREDIRSQLVATANDYGSAAKGRVTSVFRPADAPR